MTLFVRPSVAGPLVHRLVERFLDGRALPAIVVTEAGDTLSLADWLTGVAAYDRSPFNFNLAARLNLLAHPAFVSEAALSLRDRIIEAAPNPN
jgi:hypothetical protein